MPRRTRSRELNHYSPIVLLSGLESVSAFLDHSSLAITSIYVRKFEGQEPIGV